MSYNEIMDCLKLLEEPIFVECKELVRENEGFGTFKWVKHRLLFWNDKGKARLLVANPKTGEVLELLERMYNRNWRLCE